MIVKAKALSATPFPVRFIVQSGDAVLRGIDGTMWNVSFSPIIEKLSKANLPCFCGRESRRNRYAGGRSRRARRELHNALAAMSKLMPPEGSPRRLAALSDVFVWLRERVFLDDRFQHRERSVAVDMGHESAGTAGPAGVTSTSLPSFITRRSPPDRMAAIWSNRRRQ